MSVTGIRTSAPAATLNQAVRAEMPQLMALYRDLHANPELSNQEYKSAAKLAAEARTAIADHYSWDAIAREYVERLRGLVSGAAGA